jgi:hypothetical protein
MGVHASTQTPTPQRRSPSCVACGKAVKRSNEGGNGGVCEECRNAIESIASTVCVLAEEPAAICVACGKEVHKRSFGEGKGASNRVCEECKSAMESIADTVYMIADEPKAGSVARGKSSMAEGIGVTNLKYEVRKSAAASIADTTPEDDDLRHKRARPNPSAVTPGMHTPIRNPYAKTRQSAGSAACTTQAYVTPPSSQSEPVTMAHASIAAVTPGMRTPIRNPYATSASAASTAVPHVTPVTQTQNDNCQSSEPDLYVTVRLKSPTREVREHMRVAQRRGTAVRLLYNEDDHADVVASSPASNAVQAHAPPYSSNQMSLTCTIDKVESDTDQPLHLRRVVEGRGPRRMPN